MLTENIENIASQISDCVEEGDGWLFIVNNGDGLTIKGSFSKEGIARLVNFFMTDHSDAVLAGATAPKAYE